METKTYTYEDSDGSGDEAKLEVPLYIKPPLYLQLPLQSHSGSGFIEFALVENDD